MENIKIVGTSGADLEEAIRFVFGIQNINVITHAKFHDKLAVCHSLTGKNDNEINHHFDNQSTREEYGLLPVITPIDGYISMVVSWWNNKPNPYSYGDGTTVKNFTLYSGYDYGNIPEIDGKEFDNIAKLHIVVGETYYGK